MFHSNQLFCAVLAMTAIQGVLCREKPRIMRARHQQAQQHDFSKGRMHLLPYGSMLIEVADQSAPSGVWRGVSVPLGSSSLVEESTGISAMPSGSLTLGSSSQDQANLMEQEPATTAAPVAETTAALVAATTAAPVAATTGAPVAATTGALAAATTAAPVEGATAAPVAAVAAAGDTTPPPNTTAAAGAEGAVAAPSADAGAAEPGLVLETTPGPAAPAAEGAEAAKAHAYRAVNPGIAVPMCLVAVYMAATTVNKEK